ncbi:MAG: 5'-methylthioadenosine nucleosidase [Bacteroidetes bacterium QS_1_63_11]|nr:MAG: 5'-methylthioadenosine nucleosidase [Bacteroidetes bacterium QS_1_63_11]
MLGVLFSTSEEAAPFVDRHVGGRAEELEEGRYLETDAGIVTVTGPGKIKATLATGQFLRQYDIDLLIHAGGATALTDDLDVGTLVGATFVLEGDRVALDAPTYPRMPLDPPFDLSREGTLVSQDHTDDEDPDERSYWERIADMRDNTGYPIAYVAAQRGTSCHIVKGITGRVGTEDDAAERADALQAVARFLHTRADASATDSS